MRIYTPNEHHFFNQLVIFMGSTVGLFLGLAAQTHGQIAGFLPNISYIFKGNPRVSNLEFKFYPYNFMQYFINQRWPERLELHDAPLGSGAKSDPRLSFQAGSGAKSNPRLSLQVRGVSIFHKYITMSTFTHYYESIEPFIKNKHGGTTQRWPSVLNFGRIIRNACAHGGCINFKNQNANAVTWLTLTYSPENNGQDIIIQDISPVEMILLMEDMDSVL
jgi:hypothetical protein